jgi:predicted Fe-Mo cluster-binding NifX family protein
MKIAIAASNNDTNSLVDLRFGRANYFAVFDDEKAGCDYTSNNQNLSLPQGAGIQAAKNVIETGAGVLIAMNVGPKAFSLLQHSGVEMYICGKEMPVLAALELFKSGGLTKLDGANAEGHW